MTTEEIRQVQVLISRGLGYRKIATLTGISANTVKAYCNRHKSELPVVAPGKALCKGCGKPITRVPQHRQRQFCSDSCRMTYWNSHRDQVRHKLNYPKQCPCCGKEFEIRGNPNRKYCSRACADMAKRKGPVVDGR